jgi:hypothetical protein
MYIYASALTPNVPVTQIHPCWHPNIVPPSTHPNHLATVVLRSLAMVRAPGHDERNLRFRQYPSVAQEPAGHRLLSPGG